MPLQEAIAFLRNLGMSIGAGVSVREALEFLEQEASGRQRTVIAQLREHIENGATLTHAMQSSTAGFPPLAISLVQAGELSGTLERNLREVVSYLSKSRDLKRAVGGAMLYPIIVLITLFVVGMMVGIYVLPAIIPLFQSLDVDLPFATKILLRLARFFQDYGLLVLLYSLIGILICVIASRFAVVRSPLQRLMLRLPYIGKLQKQALLAQINSTLSTLLSSGIALADALPLCASSTVSLPYKKLLLQTVQHVQSGAMLAHSLEGSSLIPAMMHGFIKLGEKTGTMTKNLRYLSEFYEEEVRFTSKNLGTILEPILLIFVGLIVATMALAIISPIYRVTSSLG